MIVFNLPIQLAGITGYEKRREFFKLFKHRKAESMSEPDWILSYWKIEIVEVNNVTNGCSFSLSFT